MIRSTATRVARLATVVASPGGLRAMASWRPFSISAFRLVHALRAEGFNFETIIDVGANRGQFSAAAAGVWPQARIVAFEPLPDAAARLRDGLGRHRRVEVRETAVGDADGTVLFHPHEYSLASSVLPALARTEDRRRAHTPPDIEVALGRLDTLLAGEELASPILLKVDVQGSEPAVLAGAADTLRRTDALVIEVSFDRAYEGQALFPAVHSLLFDSGWQHCRPIDWRQDGSRIVEADFLYTRQHQP